MSPKNPLLFRQKAPSQIIEWALNKPLEYQKLRYINVQGTVNTYAKIKSMQKLVWWNSINSFSEIRFLGKAVLRFLGKHTWRRPLLSRCTPRNLERYYRKTLSNTCSCDVYEITHNLYSSGGMTAISYHIYRVVIPRQYK